MCQMSMSLPYGCRCIPNTCGVFPIHDQNKNISISELLGVTQTVVLVETNYTGLEFATEIQTQLNAAVGLAGVYTVVFDNRTERLTIVSTVSFELRKVESVAGDFLDPYDEMGFDRENLQSGTVQVGIGPVDLSGTAMIRIASSWSGQSVTTRHQRNILTEVPLRVPFGFIAYHEPAKPAEIYISTTHINHIAIQLWDAKGRLWKLPNNLGWNMTLKVVPVIADRVLQKPSHLLDDYDNSQRNVLLPFI